MSKHYRLGVDVGGTFTDLLLMDRDNGAIYPLKTPSTSNPVDAIAAGIRIYQARQGIDSAAIEYFSHGTTLAVNTLLERNGARVGLLTTEGFRDILELRRLRLPEPNNLFVPRPVPLVPRHDVKEIRERLLSDGSVLLAIDRDDVEAKSRQLVEEGVGTIAICFLHAHKNDAHEKLAKQWVEAFYPDLYVCISSEIWPQQREYERTLANVMNAYVGGRMKAYFRELQHEMSRIGIASRVFSTKSNGGVMSVEAAAERPVETLLSGPASGVIGAAFVGRLIGDQRLVTFDMGGTSVDVAVIDGEVTYSNENTVGDFPVIIPTVDVSAIGAGGGSIAWVDAEGVLKVGPRSAGAVPGPACYGRGGEAATVTDAYLTVGILRPESFLGGEMPLDRTLAEGALGQLGSRLGLEPVKTADAVLQVATANIYAALAPQLARRGVDGSEFSLFAYGAAGPTHVFMLARDLDMRRVIVPPTPGTMCALGCIAADFRSDFVQSVWHECDELSDEALRAIYQRLEHQAGEWLEAQRVELDQVYLQCSADICYSGQSYELSVPFPQTSPRRLSTQHMVQWFHDRYERIYGYVDREAPVRLLEARVQVVGVTEKPQIKLIGTDGTAPIEPVTRQVFDQGKYVEVSVYQRAGLTPGEELIVPLIVEQYDSTVYVPEGFRIHIDEHLNLIGERAP